MRIYTEKRQHYGQKAAFQMNRESMEFIYHLGEKFVTNVELILFLKMQLYLWIIEIRVKYDRYIFQISKRNKKFSIECIN